VTVKIYLDVHVPLAIADQLRRRGVEVLTAFEDDACELTDDLLLERATKLGYVLFTQDIRFRVLAETWQVGGKQFSGLIFGHQLGGTIGQFVRDLELIAKLSESDEWTNVVEYIPFK
jgi:hypothetical protein